MGSVRLNEVSATDLGHRIARGEVTVEAVVRACLERIAERDGAVQAWAFLDPDLALDQARRLDRAATRGPLHGIPIGVKDVLDTAEMPTGMGSPIYKGHRPPADASCVALVRSAGAVILGKTVTAEFAGVTPGPTVNPLDPGRTPGGSSSGSAAALADLMVPVAFGTQTGGSILRPASFCGVVGFKPSYNAINRAGLKFAAESLDTIGLMARELDDIALFRAVLLGEPPAPLAAPAVPPRVGLCRTPLWRTAGPATVEAVEDAADRLGRAGAAVREVVLPAAFEGLSAARETINNVERARALAYEWANHRAAISAALADGIAKGLATPPAAYAEALALAARCRSALAAAFAGVDVLLAPCVPGEAPAGLAWTGDTRLQAFWTLLHVPTVSLPTHRGPAGLPVAVQVIGPAGGDARLLAAARWMWATLGSWRGR